MRENIWQSLRDLYIGVALYIRYAESLSRLVSLATSYDVNNKLDVDGKIR